MDLTVKIATLLLEAGCDPTSRTKEGRTALMMAVEQVGCGFVALTDKWKKNLKNFILKYYIILVLLWSSYLEAHIVI